MSEQSGKFPVKVDVGLSAKAEIKGEIPSGSMGRLVDALTDAIRPFTESRGLRADQIRLQREDVLIAIAAKASERLRLENLEIVPVASKILIPLLEKASLEDPSDTFMIEKWSDLLASAATGEFVEPRLVSILSELSSQEASILEEIFEGESQTDNKFDPEVLDAIGKFRPNFNGITRRFDARIVQNDISELWTRDRPFDHILAYSSLILTRRGLRPTLINLANTEKFLEHTPITKSISSNEESSIGILRSLGLLDEHEYRCHLNNYFIEGRYVQISALGLRFLSMCSFKIQNELRQMLPK